MSPAILRFEATCGGIESEPVVISCRGSERYRMDFVHHDVNMEMLFVVVRDDHILMMFISKRLQCLDRAICPLWSSRAFSWRPCQFVMANCILAAIVERSNSLHFSCCGAEAQKIPRQNHIPSQDKFSSLGITLLCKVFTKALEAAGVLSRWLHLDDHVYFSATMLSVLTALRTADNIKLSSLRRPSSSGRPLICMSRYF